jgi:transposase
MPARLPELTVRRIVLQIADGQSASEVAKSAMVSKRTVERIQLNIDLFNTPYPPTTVKLGRPRTMLPYHAEVR